MIIRIFSLFLVSVFLSTAASADKKTEKWHLDTLINLSGKTITRLGNPVSVESMVGRSIRFDGEKDGLIVAENPLAGYDSFTIEVLFNPSVQGLPEQRFLHFEDDNQNRGLIEIRLNGDRSWSLDTFLYAPASNSRLTLLDRVNSHKPDEWYWVALSYDGTTMRHFVNGREELSGEVDFPPTTRGSVSIGARLNGVHWFKGMISEVRFHNYSLAAEELQAIIINGSGK